MVLKIQREFVTRISGLSRNGPLLPTTVAMLPLNGDIVFDVVNPFPPKGFPIDE